MNTPPNVNHEQLEEVVYGAPYGQELSPEQQVLAEVSTAVKGFDDAWREMYGTTDRLRSRAMGDANTTVSDGELQTKQLDYQQTNNQESLEYVKGMAQNASGDSAAGYWDRSADVIRDSGNDMTSAFNSLTNSPLDILSDAQEGNQADARQTVEFMRGQIEAMRSKLSDGDREELSQAFKSWGATVLDDENSIMDGRSRAGLVNINHAARDVVDSVNNLDPNYKALYDAVGHLRSLIAEKESQLTSTAPLVPSDPYERDRKDGYDSYGPTAKPIRQQGKQFPEKSGSTKRLGRFLNWLLR